MNTNKALLNVAVFGTLLALATTVFAFGPNSGRQTLKYNGAERHYLLRLPDSMAQGGQRMPLVLVLHGGGGNGENAEKMTGFTDKAAREGFVVVYPEGTGRRRNKHLTWNAGHCCGPAMEKRVDDVGFIRALIDELVALYPIDPRRIYVTGMSNGGMMSHRLGIELADKLAAIAPVVATVFGDEQQPAQPVSAIMINGLLDKSVPNQGGPPGGRFADAWDGTHAKPAMHQLTFWANADGCRGAPEKKETATVTRWKARCPEEHAVELIVVKDNGHAWPGGNKGSFLGDTPSTSLHATDVIWDFFKAHPRK